ncbi:MAG: hypothetical protein GX275_09350 [Clostridiales bacterium]|nr:hypothetical protein [Clostridiales bacterium]
MDFENEVEQKVGTGIKVISILYFIGNGIGLIGTLISLMTLDTINSELKKLGQSQLTVGSLIFSFLFGIIMILGCALVLAKKKIGVIIFVVAVVANLIYALIYSSSNILLTLVSNLIIPALYLFFIFKQKELYFGEK